jgi:hypothetical protein
MGNNGCGYNLATSDPPHPFYRIEFGRVRRQKDKYQALLIYLEEFFELFGSVPSGIVQNKIEFSLSRLEKITYKVAKGLSIEGGSFLSKKTTGLQVECSEEAHFVTDRRRKYARLLSFWRPHSYQTAVSLEMDFVLAPKLNAGVLH